MHDMSLCGACKFGDCVWIKESQRITQANKKNLMWSISYKLCYNCSQFRV